MIGIEKKGRWSILALALVLLIAAFSLSFAGDPRATPVPKVIRLDAGDKDYLQVLGGPPETFTMRSGLVVLAAGKSVGKHSTEDFEELVIVLEGQGEMPITGGETLSLSVGNAIYCPSHKEHDVMNTGSGPLRYLYVVAKAQ